MTLFQLVLQTSREVAPETLQFSAADVPAALAFANRHTTPFPAELWQDGKRVCMLAFCETSGTWVITGEPPAALSAVQGRLTTSLDHTQTEVALGDGDFRNRGGR